MTELDNLIAEWTGTLTADDLLARLHEGGVPAGRIFRARDMFADPHFAAREAIVRVPHPDFGRAADAERRAASCPSPPGRSAPPDPRSASTTNESGAACSGSARTSEPGCATAAII